MKIGFLFAFIWSLCCSLCCSLATAQNLGLWLPNGSTGVRPLGTRDVAFHDSDGTHLYTFDMTGNATAARTISWNFGDAARTLTVSGNPTLNDWFDQSVKAAATPTFVGVDLATGELVCGSINRATGALTLEIGGTAIGTIAANNIKFQTSTDATTGFQVLDADGGIPVFSVDTTNELVGIGVAAPSAPLEINASVPKARYTDREGGWAEFSGSGGSFTFSADAGNTQPGSRIAFEVDQVEKVRIDLNGHVQIKADNSKLMLGAAQDASIYYDGADMQFDSQEVGTGDFIFNNGNVGLGVASPTYQLELTGDIAQANSKAYYFRNAADTGWIIGFASNASDEIYLGGYRLAVGTSGSGSVKLSFDDEKLLFGAGQDASVYYDGTDMQINPQEVGSGALKVVAGDLSMTNGAMASAVETVGALGVGATTFAVDSNVCTITGDAGGNTVSTITGGVAGQMVVLLFTDANVSITDTNAHTANTVDLSAAFTSADDTTLTLVFDGTSWYETSRSVN